MVMTDIKTAMIDALCQPIEEIELTGRTVGYLNNYGIKFFGQVLTYSRSNFRQMVLEGTRRAYGCIDKHLTEINFAGWPSGLMGDETVRQAKNQQELRSYLEEKDPEFFADLLIDQSGEVGVDVIAKRKSRAPAIEAALPTRLREILKKTAYDELVAELAERNSPPENIRSEALDILARKADLDGLAVDNSMPVAPQTLGKG